MLRKIFPILLLLILAQTAAVPKTAQGRAQQAPSDFKTLFFPLALNTFWKPVLKWSYGGCTSWCETGWYSSPAAVDINNDQKNEIIAAGYSLFALDGETGAQIWKAGSGQGRTWPGIVAADIDQDGKKEILTAQGDGTVSAYDLQGAIKWKKQPAGGGNELRGLLAADLEGDNSSLEIVVTRASGSAKNTWVLDSSGNTRSGWPQLPKDQNNANGYGWGVYNANAAAADLNQDGRKEIVIPSDVHYINAYEPDGSLLMANSSEYPGKTWGQVGVWENLVPEKRGYGDCNGIRSESYRTNFADGPAVLADLNGDGQREVVVTGNMYDCHAGYPPSRYTAVFVFNPDRTRFNSGGFDWTTIPVDTGAPLSEDYNKIETAEANPAVADLDGDGKQEILFSSYDGRVHAFWLDKTEHNNWPYSVYHPEEKIIRFASEPVVADLNNDGKGEIIFTSWAQKGSRQNGKLHILDWTGLPIFETDLPAPLSTSDTWNGAMGAPTLANVDGDSDLELIINTAHSGVVVYDLPGTAQARILWGTGRGNLNRDGAK